MYWLNLLNQYLIWFLTLLLETWNSNPICCTLLRTSVSNQSSKQSISAPSISTFKTNLFLDLLIWKIINGVYVTFGQYILQEFRKKFLVCFMSYKLFLSGNTFAFYYHHIFITNNKYNLIPLPFYLLFINTIEHLPTRFQRCIWNAHKALYGVC